MSPGVALRDPTFAFYALLLLGMLGSAGGLLAVLRFVARKNINHAWQSYRGWLVMVPAVLAALFAGRAATIAFFSLLAAAGCWEFFRATGLREDRWAMGAALLGVFAQGGAALVTDPFLGVSGWYGLFMALPAFTIASIFLTPILRDQTAGQLRTLALTVMGYVYFGWMFQHVAYLANSSHAYAYLFFLLFAVELNDVAAFTTGKLLGRRKLRAHISPNKTIGGSLGAVAVSLLLPWLLRSQLPESLTPWDLIVIGLIVGVGGQIGDLAISVLKRDLGIKDMGTLIPGHGGVLDRIDSLIYVAPLFLHWIRYRHDLY